mmetsp:Transcript_1975/g.5210  ORF Transcript_1975/g.5210 Transcript_1975/m.5210 type:complete len:217 (+) Transcript_1975:3309-3959(+)
MRCRVFCIECSSSTMRLCCCSTTASKIDLRMVKNGSLLASPVDLSIALPEVGTMAAPSAAPKGPLAPRMVSSIADPDAPVASPSVPVSDCRDFFRGRVATALEASAAALLRDELVLFAATSPDSLCPLDVPSSARAESEPSPITLSKAAPNVRWQFHAQLPRRQTFLAAAFRTDGILSGWARLRSARPLENARDQVCWRCAGNEAECGSSTLLANR